ncbi:MAG: TatD family hydrolase [Prevotellaceae bacterium]|jgi:TatD DNase family protein|nr:TatD family hydrolase [Prevotellaceae bacterium]
MKYIDIHTHRKKNNENILSLQNISPEKFIQQPGYENNCFSAGIHPWYIDTTLEDKINILKQIASNPAVLAIGETGLDKICKTDFDLQKRAFNAQISIAGTVQKPLIIHCVKAYNEVQQVLKEAKTNVPVLFHGFRGKPQLAKELTNAGFYLSFGNLFNEESLKQTPIDRIFLETDDADIEIEKIYTLVAEVKGLSVNKLIKTVNENFERCFGRQSL